MSRDDELVEVAVEIRRERPLAIGVSDGTGELKLGDGKETLIWLPRSQLTEIRREKGNFAVVTLPAWLATEKGLI